MIVTYETVVVAQCPVDKTVDMYDLTVTMTDNMVPVENILDAIQKWTQEPIFQEDLTAALQATLGGTVKTEGVHSGVKTVVVAP